MAAFNNLSELAAYIQQKANSALKNEVAKTAQEEMQTQIQEKVYDAYEPMYPENRRMYDDGLIDPRNIEIQQVNDDTISIEDIAYDGARNVPYIVESGQGYYPGAPDALTKGRKFTEATREELKKSDKLKIAMVQGLKRQGIDAL